MSEQMAWQNVPEGATVQDRHGIPYKVLVNANGTVCLGRQDRTTITVNPDPNATVDVVWLPPKDAPALDPEMIEAAERLRQHFPGTDPSCIRCITGDITEACSCEQHCGARCCINFRTPLPVP